MGIQQILTLQLQVDLEIMKRKRYLHTVQYYWQGNDPEELPFCFMPNVQEKKVKGSVITAYPLWRDHYEKLTLFVLPRKSENGGVCVYVCVCVRERERERERETMTPIRMDYYRRTAMINTTLRQTFQSQFRISVVYILSLDLHDIFLTYVEIPISERLFFVLLRLRAVAPGWSPIWPVLSTRLTASLLMTDFLALVSLVILSFGPVTGNE